MKGYFGEVSSLFGLCTGGKGPPRLMTSNKTRFLSMVRWLSICLTISCLPHANAQGVNLDLTIVENLGPNSIIGNCKSIDSAASQCGNTSPDPFFYVDSDTGNVLTKVKIDREVIGDSHRFLIDINIVSRVQREVTVIILDLNDNIPVFSNSTHLVKNVTVQEEADPMGAAYSFSPYDPDQGLNGSEGIVMAMDTDYRSVFTFEVARASPTSQPVGTLTVNGKFDREVTDLVQVHLRATDGGGRTGIVTINFIVKGINDNLPVFDITLYQTRIFEDSPVGYSVLNVSATDADLPKEPITYSLTDTRAFLGLDSNTGELKMATAFSLAKHKGLCARPCPTNEPKCLTVCRFGVLARDTGNQAGAAQVDVIVLDSNNNSPVISPVNPIRLSETTLANRFVALLTSTDADKAENGQISLAITGGNALGLFTIRNCLSIALSSRCFLYTTKNLDTTDVSLFNLKVTATDKGTPSLSSSIFVVVHVLAANNHRPVFTMPVYRGTVSELDPPGSFVASVTATDADEGVNGQVNYGILGGNEYNFFTIDHLSGLVTVSKPMDFDQFPPAASEDIISPGQRLLRLTVSAYDLASTRFTTAINVSITAINENDQTPKFMNPSLDVSIEENRSLKALITQLTITDDDSGVNGTVLCTLAPDSKFTDTFAVERVDSEGKRWQVTTLKELNREVKAQYVINIVARDGGRPALQSSMVIRLNVTDANDNSPSFYPKTYRASIRRVTPSGTFITTVHATDIDAGLYGQVTYRILSGAQGRFAINPLTGVISSSSDRMAEVDSYRLVVIAVDGGMLSAQANVHITVENEAEALPVFGQPDYYHFTIDEGKAGIVGQVQAKVDGVPVTSYSIVDGDSSLAFSISNTGSLSASEPLDREVQNFYNLTVSAIGLTKQSFSNVRVLVKDINDNSPQFESGTNDRITVGEDTPVSTIIYVAHATDLDSNLSSLLTYTLMNDPDNFFKLSPSTGALSLLRSVTFGDTFAVQINASDNGLDRKTTTLSLVISVTDVNDHSPVFEQSAYEVSVREDAILSHPFLKVVALDEDAGLNGSVTYSIKLGNEDGAFGIFPDGTLYVAKHLDRERVNRYMLHVEASDNGVTIKRKSMTTVTVKVKDVNDNDPLFTQLRYEFHVREGDQAGSYVGTISATDDDDSRNGEVLYFFFHNQRDFKLDPITGDISSQRKFDRESLPNDGTDVLTLPVIAYDNGEVQRNDAATVNVQINDVNDNAPVFVKNVFRFHISENSQQGTNVGWVQASDADSGANAFIIYAAVSDGTESPFTIRPDGAVLVNGLLNREVKTFHSLTIEAVDDGKPQLKATAKLEVLVDDVNDNSPKFTKASYTFSVREDAYINHVIGSVAATDEDLGPNGDILFSFVVNPDGHFGTDGCFEIDGITGKISLTCHLDFETKRQYFISLKATDYGSPSLSGTADLIINVADINDNAPIFTIAPTSEDVYENIGLNTTIATVKATDRDGKPGNGDVEYRILFQNPATGHFGINPVSGDIWVLKELDYEEVQDYSLIIEVTDLAPQSSLRLSATHRLTIQILDRNDNPPVFVSPTAVTLPMLSGSSTPVATVATVDIDSAANSRVEYQIEGTSDLFAINSNTGEITLTRALPVGALMQVTVRATDRDATGLHTSQTLTVIVTNPGPTRDVLSFTNSRYDVPAVEDVDIGSQMIQLQLISDRPSVEYYITSATANGASVQHLFEIDQLNAQVRTAAMLDYESPAKVISLTVIAVDPAAATPTTGTTTVVITVGDINDTPPQFLLPEYYAVISEDVSPGHLVVQLNTTDPDLTGTLQYSITQGNDLQTFTIDPSSGELKTAKAVDRETTPTYTLVVVASDGINNAFVSAHIQVTDVNDMPPEFDKSPLSFEIEEDAAINSPIGTIRAQDEDSGEGGEVVYEIRSTWKRNLFHLDRTSGLLTVKGNLDFETYPHYILEIEASDQGSPSLSSNVTVYVNVKDLNDNHPQFDVNSFSPVIPENLAQDTVIVNVTASDPDSGINGQIQYSIVGGNEGLQFDIEPTTGSIFTTAALDRELASSYTLTVMATDLALPVTSRKNSTITVDVTIEDINDNAPILSSSRTIYVCECAELNSTIGHLNASDKDHGQNAQVTFSLPLEYQSMFRLTDQGELILTQDLDRETVPTYAIRVLMTDGGSPTLFSQQNLTVVVTDVNDNSPVFSDGHVTVVNLREDVTSFDTLLELNATDADEGLNGAVQYYIISGDESEDFVVDQHSGIFHTSRTVDYERKSRYDLVIQTIDSGQPPRSTLLNLTVNLVDINDVPPQFTHGPYRVLLRENTPAPAIVTQVIANRGDLQSGQLLYSMTPLTAPGTSSPFTINSNTGVVTCSQLLDRETLTSTVLDFQVRVEAVGPLKTTTAITTLTIVITDENDNAPYFDRTQPTLGARVYEDIAENSPLFQVTAQDDDEGQNAEVRYSLRGAQEKFVINSATGWVYTAAPLDRERQAAYSIEVVASDSGLIPMTTTIPLFISVVDVDDETPAFANNVYHVISPDPLALGSFVFGVTASDPDLTAVQYQLSGADASLLTINRTTGIIRAAQQLTGLQAINCIIQAVDEAGHLASTNLTVTFTGASQPFPAFTTAEQRFSFGELTILGADIAKVHALSPKSSPLNVITYYITGGNTHQRFAVGRTSGEITLDKYLDYEATQSYDLWIEARDSDTNNPLSSYANVIVNVIDINDNSPVFTQPVYEASYTEELSGQVQVVLTTVSALDADSGLLGEVTYSIVSGNVDGYFSVNDVSGEVSTHALINREVNPEFTLTVKAEDKGTPPLESTCQVHVTILDIDDHGPQFTHPYDFSLYENSPIGFPIGYVEAVDADVGQFAAITYSTSDPDSHFMVSPSGNLSLAQRVDRETRETYNLVIVATSVNRPEISASIGATITVLDFNDNRPQFKPSAAYSLVFPENLPAGSLVGTLVATDDDEVGPNSALFYQLEAPSSLFSIDTFTGNITSLRTLTYKSGLSGKSNRYSLSVVCEDRGTPSLLSRATVTISVTDANDHAPQFMKDLYTEVLPANLMNGASILSLKATDLDAGNNAVVGYEILSNSTGSGLFNLNQTSGDLSLSGSLANRVGTSYQLSIKASDHGVPPLISLTTVYLTVIANNMYPPVISTDSNREATVKENIDVGSSLGQVIASDRDSGLNGQVAFSITAGNDLGWFAINSSSGVITVAAPLDSDEGRTLHSLTIEAADQSLQPLSDTMTFTVIIEDVNDNIPLFVKSSMEAFIYENEPADTKVIDVSATDKDSTAENRRMYFSIDQQTPELAFAINHLTGLITTRRPFNFENPHEKVLSIIVRVANPDQIVKHSLAEVKVYVKGVNEFYPHMVAPNFAFSVSEKAILGTSVGQVAGFDADDGTDGNLLFFLISESNDMGFYLEKKSGILKVARALDRELNSVITLHALVKNPGPITGNDTDSCTIHITLSDANDAPAFNQSRYDVSVNENEADAYVTTVFATDLDQDPRNAKFNYSIATAEGVPSDEFVIDNTHGVIRTAVKLDRETQQLYILVVSATDQGNPPATGSTVVYVTVMDTNDQAPYFLPAVPRDSIRENVGRHSGVINLSNHTFDDDEDPNAGPFRYQLDHPVFRVDGVTGLITLKQDLNFEDVSQYNLTITVSDNGNVPQVSNLIVTIDIIDQNDRPLPRPLSANVRLFGSLPVNTIIAPDVSPLDEDEVVAYSCSTPLNTFFEIPPNTCVLRSSKPVTSSVQVNLTVTGSDKSQSEPFPDVQYNVMVDTRVFSNDSIKEFAAIKIFQLTSQAFLDSYYSRFVSSLETHTKDRPVELFSMKTLASHLELYFVSFVANEPHSSSLADYLLPKLPVIAAGISSNLQVVDPGLCPAGVPLPTCRNRGTCVTRVHITYDSWEYHSSNRATFAGHSARLVPACKCAQGYQGDDCSIETKSCVSAPCRNGATCSAAENTDLGFSCSCTSGWTGALCADDVNECQRSAQPLCQNGGTCMNTPGSYHCKCNLPWGGPFCQERQNVCIMNPGICQNGGLCSHRESFADGYECDCTFGYFGKNCERVTLGFQELSYMSTQPLQETSNTIVIVMATVQLNNLLLYQRATPDSGILSVETVQGEVQVYESLNNRQRSATVFMNVDTGAWFRITVVTGDSGYVKVETCTLPDACISCSDLSTCSSNLFEIGQSPAARLTSSSPPLLIGGITSVADIVNNKHIHSADFIGCIASININQEVVTKDNVMSHNALLDNACPRPAQCQPDECNGGQYCDASWFSAPCSCSGYHATGSCLESPSGYAFGAQASVQYTTRETYLRQPYLQSPLGVADEGLRKKRQLWKQYAGFSLSFRSGYTEATLVRVVHQSSAAMVLKIRDGRVELQSDVVVLTHSAEVSDGAWHNVSMGYMPRNGGGATVQLFVDKSLVQKQLAQAHSVLNSWSLSVASITLGGEFEGCLNGFSLGNRLPMVEAVTPQFTVTTSGSVRAGCGGCPNAVNVCSNGRQCVADGGTAVQCVASTAPAPEGLSDVVRGVIIVLCVVVAFLVVLAVAAVLIRRKRMRRKQRQTESGQSFTNLVKPEKSEKGSTYAFDNYQREMMADEVDHPIHHEQLSRLDLDVSTFSPLPPGRTVPSPYVQMDTDPVIIEGSAIGDQEDPREFYDLDEASIAPSDCDIHKYYKAYREGVGHPHRLNHQPVTTPATHRNTPQAALPARPPSRHHNTSPLDQRLRSQTPNGRSQSRATPSFTPGHTSGRQSAPLSNQSASLRQTPIDELNRRIAKDRRQQTRNSESSFTDDNHSVSRGTPNWAPSGPSPSHTPYSHNGRPTSAASRPQSRSRQATTPKMAFEMERLGNRRAHSSSSDEPHSPARSPPPMSALRPSYRNHHHGARNIYSSEGNDSSSADESSISNDSFTASEYEHDPEGSRAKVGDLVPNGGSMMFTKLQEVEEESDSADPTHFRTTFSWEGLRKVDNSLNQYFRNNSDSNTDGDSVTKLPKKPGTGGFKWDHFFNWGPSFEKLVGVFRDISELPQDHELELSPPQTEAPPHYSNGHGGRHPDIIADTVADEYV